MSVFKLFIFLFLFLNLQASELIFTQEEKNFIKEHPVLRVQNERSWAPIDFRANGKAKGYAVDNIKLLAQKAGFKVRFIPGRSWSVYLQMLDEKRLDVISSMKITPQRRNYTIFLKYPVLELYNGILQKKETHYGSIKELEGKIVAVVNGYYQEELLKLHYPKVKIIKAKDILEAMNLVLDGQADATIEYHSVLQYNITRYFFTGLHSVLLLKNKHFSSTRQYIGIRNDWPLLQSILDKTAKSQSHKIVQDLRTKWLTKIQNRHIVLNKDERLYLKNKKVISFCSDPNWLPIEKIEHNKHFGIAAEYLKRMSSNMDIRFKLIPTTSWNQSLEYIKSKRCDFLSSVIRTDKRKKYMNFTSSYMNMTLVITTKSDTFFINSLKNIKGKRIGIVSNYAYKKILKHDYSNVEIVTVKNVYDGLKRVESGDIYAYVDTLEATSYELRTSSFSNLKISGKLEEKISLSFGIRKDDFILFDILEKALASISSTQKKKIYDKWVYVSIDQTDYSLIWKILGALALLLFFLFYRYKITLNYNSQLLGINKELEKLNIQLEELSQTDQLTKLSNRRCLDENLSHEIKRAIRYETDLCVILIDIDYFKKVNDSYGHPQGDEVLKKVAQILRENSREVDTVGRWGGEEFLIILSQVDLEQATSMCEKLRQKIKAHDFGLKDPITASFGVTKLHIMDDEHSLLSRVDSNLYEAKDNGRDKIIAS
ncbi:MAG: hypothetical protein COA44_13855 [Arcobacter sp.]|nr:MAG: hypothetical protein COA44_13855 [Arcobacter sp.]